MLFLLSPAKSLDYDTPAGDVPHSLPQFAAQSAQLIQNLKPQSLKPQGQAEALNYFVQESAMNFQILLMPQEKSNKAKEKNV